MTDSGNPWKTLGTRQVYENPWIRVSEDDVIHPSGAPGIYGRVSFRNLAVGIIPLDDEDHTWLVGQYRYATENYSWEIPMGGSPLADDPLAGAQRELREETGLTARRWTRLLKVHLSNSVTDEVGLVYLAEQLAEGEPDFGETERITIRRLPFSDALAMVMDGEITDVLSVAGVLKLALLRR
ncbi:MAG: NUDIX hydrolase [Chromatiales bacterium]|nr:NUDIX hydrolase [Chromatiales bacterium]